MLMTVAHAHILVGRAVRDIKAEVFNVADNKMMDKDDFHAEKRYVNDDSMNVRKRDDSTETKIVDQ